MARVVEGRRRWLARVKAAGIKAPCGRKPGPSKKARARREAERRAALTPAERFVEDHNATLAAGLKALDAIEARLVGAQGISITRMQTGERPVTELEQWLSAVGPASPASQAPALPSPQAVADEPPPFDAVNDLEDLTRLSLGKARALLEAPLAVRDLGPEADAKRFDRALQLAKLQLGVVDRILTTQTRVDETRLRRRQVDVLPRLLAIIEEEKRALAEGERRTIEEKAAPQNIG
jgi:hypothetical protein